jgi:hypothetical protein
LTASILCGLDTSDVGKDAVDLEAEDIVAESVKYLEARGLLEHHADNFDWVLLRDESE